VERPIAQESEEPFMAKQPRSLVQQRIPCAQVVAEFWFHLGIVGAVVNPPPRFAYAYRLGLRTAALKQREGGTDKVKQTPRPGTFFRSRRLRGDA
jgi:hypothetical protein